MLLNYKTYGDSGKAVFILHGIFGMLDNWHLIAKALSETYRVFTLDARNHGGSGHTDDMSYQLMAEDVIELADHLQIDSFILIGHSMGGKTAMWTAHQFPDRIEKLVVVDIAPKAYKPGHQVYFNAFKNIAWETLQSRKDVDDALMVYETDPGVRLFLAKNIERRDGGGFMVKSNIEALSKSYDEIIGPLDFSKPYSGPVLFILGDRSNYLSEHDKPYIKTWFPKAEFAIVADAGHWVHADNPREFLEKLKPFLV